jgi:hypothetical protein
MALIDTHPLTATRLLLWHRENCLPSPGHDPDNRLPSPALFLFKSKTMLNFMNGDETRASHDITVFS